MNSRPYEIHERQSNGDWEIVATWATEDEADNDLVWLKLHHPLRSYMIVVDNIDRTENFTDFYGCTATITVCIDGCANLAVRTDRGSLVHAKTYNTYRGAKIAMGKMSDCWSMI